MPHWGDDGTIVFRAGNVGISRVPESGGEPTMLVEGNFNLPRLLPGGRGILLTGPGPSIHLLDLEADTVRELVPGGADPRYVDTGHLLWADDQGGLWAAPFDLDAGELAGDGTPILEGVSIGLFFARFDVSRNGTLVYGLGRTFASTAVSLAELLVVGLDGQEQVTPLPRRVFEDVRWAPDGERVAYSGTEAGAETPQPFIFTYNVTLGTTPRRLTFDGINFRPVWSPDGTRIAFASAREGTDGWDLFVKTVDDDAPPVRVLGGPGRQRPTDWPEGDLVLLNSGTSRQQNDIWTVELPDSATSAPYLPAEGNRINGHVDPDGRLAAYQSDESGRYEIYVRAFPEPRQPVIVSQGGGQFPRWSPAGDAIYYWRESMGGPDSLFVARVQRDPTFAVVATELVLAGDYDAEHWDLHPDGDRLVVPRLEGTVRSTAGDGPTDPVRHLIVSNWFIELRAAVGDGGGG
jgi:Tol biopolymer transport system component